jgi:hypothetical protein
MARSISMTANPSDVIVVTENCSFHSVHGSSVHHRAFPEVRGEGSSPEDAAERLAQQLSRTLDSVPSDWRKEMLNRAIEDVRAFANREHAASACSRSATRGSTSNQQ